MRELLNCFLIHEVRFMVIGGHAVSFHGYPRFTKDLDIWIERCPSNAEKVVSALKEFGLDFDGLSEEIFTDESRMTQMGREPNRVDILHTIKGVQFDECYERSVRAIIDGTPIPIISKEDLLSNKMATARPQDLADANQLKD
ncbi:MAG: nucleotidyltransferase [Luteolibacter sp.]